jgi:hypothetical protein
VRRALLVLLILTIGIVGYLIAPLPPSPRLYRVQRPQRVWPGLRYSCSVVAVTLSDTLDALTGFAVLLALMLAVAAWIHTVTEWGHTWGAFVKPFAVMRYSPSVSLLTSRLAFR